MRRSRLSARNNAFESNSDINPMESVGNLADVMLVFACGLLLALVAAWNVDIGIDRTNMSEDVYPIDEVKESAEDDVNEGSLEQIGTVYLDPVTGKWYFKEGN